MSQVLPFHDFVQFLIRSYKLVFKAQFPSFDQWRGCAERAGWQLRVGPVDEPVRGVRYPAHAPSQFQMHPKVCERVCVGLKVLVRVVV